MNSSSGMDPSQSSGSVGSNPVGTVGEAVTARTSRNLKHVLVLNLDILSVCSEPPRPLIRGRSLPRTRTCSSFVPWETRSSSTPSALRSASATAGWPASTPGSCWASSRREVLRRAGVEPELVEQVVGGCVSQAGEQSNDMVRRAWLHAGLPQPTGATTIDAQCGSGQQAAHLVNDMIRAGTIKVGIACGVESMSRIPLGANVPPGAGDPRPESWTIDMPNQFEGADRIARNRGLGRADLEAFGCESQRKARVAVDEGRFEREIAAAGGPGHRQGDRQADRGDASRLPGRGPARHHHGGPGEAPVGAPGRPAHGRHVLPDQRRRLRGAADGLRPRRVARADPARPDRRPRPGRLGPLLPPRRPDRRHPPAARAHRHDARGHGPVRGQRGVRVRRTLLGAADRSRPRADERQRRRDRAGSPGRLDRHPPDHDGAARARATRRRPGH